MKLKSLNCPNCGASVEIVDGLDTFFCTFCGSKIILEGQSSSAYRAKTRVKKMEHDERMLDKKFAHDRFKIKHKTKAKFLEDCIPFILILAAILIFPIWGAGEKRKSDKQEAELQQLVDEIQEDIEDEKFDTAYVKAKQIKYTANYSDDIEDKWDDTRRAVIDQIIEAEKKATGTSEHEPEKKGWFN